MTERETLKLALEALENSQNYVEASANEKFLHGWGEQLDVAENAIKAIKEALAQPEQEQSGFFSREAMKAHSDFHVAQPEQGAVTLDVSGLTGFSLIPANWNSCAPNEYNTPPQRTWVGLTNKEIGECIDEVNATSQYGHHHFGWHLQLAKDLEAKLKEKNCL